MIVNNQLELPKTYRPTPMPHPSIFICKHKGNENGERLTEYDSAVFQSPHPQLLHLFGVLQLLWSLQMCRTLPGMHEAMDFIPNTTHTYTHARIHTQQQQQQNPFYWCCTELTGFPLSSCFSLKLSCHIQRSKRKIGIRTRKNGSIDKGTSHQVWPPEFDPQSPKRRSRMPYSPEYGISSWGFYIMKAFEYFMASVQ